MGICMAHDWLKGKMKQYLRKPGSLALLLLLWASGIVIMAVVALIIGYTMIKGIPYIKPELFEWRYTSENHSLMPALINTIVITGLALVITVPVGVAAAVFLTEYSAGGRFVKTVRLTAETLSGIPSIVFGLFGYLVFVITCGFGYSILAGGLTLATMILPTILRTTEEALISVPDMYREGSFGLGAGRLRTVFRVVLPSAFPAILSGIILSVGRIVGETAALLYTAGSVAGISKSLLASGRTLSVHLYALLSEGMYMEDAYATAVILMVFVIVINTVSGFAGRRRRTV